MKQLTAAIFLAIAIIQPAYSKAIYNQHVDEFTGEDNSSVLIFEDKQEENMSLAIGWKCLRDGLNVILLHDYLAGDSDDEVAVQTKFDDKPPSGIKFYALASNNEVTFFDMGDVETFTNAAMDAAQFMIRVTDPHDNEQLTAAFRPEGLDDELPKLLCYP
jgi:hypothetical protein